MTAVCFFDFAFLSTIYVVRFPYEQTGESGRANQEALTLDLSPLTQFISWSDLTSALTVTQGHCQLLKAHNKPGKKEKGKNHNFNLRKITNT